MHCSLTRWVVGTKAKKPDHAGWPGLGAAQKARGLRASSCRHWVRRDVRPTPRVEATKQRDRKSTRLNSSHLVISYAVFCLKKKTHKIKPSYPTISCRPTQVPTLPRTTPHRPSPGP